MLNRVILIGRLTRDPELKRISSGVALTNFTLAVDRKFKSASGERETDFIRIVTWDKTAELCKEYLAKGQLAAVEGRLQVRSWEAQGGEKRTTYEVNAESVQFLERPSGRRQGGSEPPSSAYEDDYESGGQDDARETRAPVAPRQPQQSTRRDFGNVSDRKLDEEIDLDDDDPFKEEF